ncbi:MAG: hypothetical protein GY854_14225 [Deltaproteobacteria bacterium]|nr:hypothetical protein [Deltaproteobacteria bacterium]
MKKVFSVALLLAFIASPALGQNFTDDFEGVSSSDFAASSADWEAVWTGDGWKASGGGVSPNTEIGDPGGFGAPADHFENAIVAGDESWQDYSVEAQFHVDDVDALGIVFRYTSPDSFYLLVMSRSLMPSSDGSVEALLEPETRLYRIYDGTATALDPVNPIESASYEDDPGLTQNVRVEVASSFIKIWIGGGDSGIDTSSSPLAEFEDPGPGPTRGRVGLYAFAMGGAGTRFDEVRVRFLDSDGDGKNNDDEIEAGTDPFDADSDDDGIPDGTEFRWDQDSDSDGDINAMDWDSDNDGLPDGLECSYTEPDSDTNVDAGHFIADDDPTTQTDHLNADSDSGGHDDGQEDLNKNGRFEPSLGETNPNSPDDDGEYPDVEPDAGGDVDTDIDTDVDTDADTDTDESGDEDAGYDTDTSDTQDEADAGWGGLYGGPGCSCEMVGVERVCSSIGIISLIFIYL